MTPRLATLTMNPAIDHALSADGIRPTHKMRARDLGLSPGGGGINVARVARELGADAVAVMLAGGPTGALLGSLLDEAGLPHVLVPIQGATRMCVTAADRGTGREYRFVAPGPVVAPHEWRGALEALDATDCDWAVASGSLPPGVPAEAYAVAARDARLRGRGFALDTSGPALGAALRQGGGVDVAKLSLGELESFVGRPLPDALDQEREAAAIVRAGMAVTVAVTLGEDGAFLADRDGVLRSPSPAVQGGSAVGAGDSFMAALVTALARGLAPGDALELGVATGAAAAAAGGASRVSAADVAALLPRVRGLSARRDGAVPAPALR